jgi:hypothetical protein
MTHLSALALATLSLPLVITGCVHPAPPLATPPMMDTARCAQDIVLSNGFEVRHPGDITSSSPSMGDGRYGFDAERRSGDEGELLQITIEPETLTSPPIINVFAMSFLRR